MSLFLINMLIKTHPEYDGVLKQKGNNYKTNIIIAKVCVFTTASNSNGVTNVNTT